MQYLDLCKQQNIPMCVAFKRFKHHGRRDYNKTGLRILVPESDGKKIQATCLISKRKIPNDCSTLFGRFLCRHHTTFHQCRSRWPLFHLPHKAWSKNNKFRYRGRSILLQQCHIWNEREKINYVASFQCALDCNGAQGDIHSFVFDILCSSLKQVDDFYHGIGNKFYGYKR